MLDETISDLKNFTSDKEILRVGILAEIDAINLYEQLATKASDSRVKELMLDIAQEEKVHFGEFEGLLELIDPEHEPAEDEAEEELEDMGISEAEKMDMKKIHSEIEKFLKKNPRPSDKEIHKLADDIGIDEHEFEEHIYMMLADLLKKK